MKDDLLKLKTRLKLKFLQKQIDAEIENNFGHPPNTIFFAWLTEDIDRWLEIAKNKFPDLYNNHCEDHFF